MPTKNKNTSKEEKPMDLGNFVVKFLQDSAVTIFWESVDRFKKEVRVRMEIGLKLIIGFLTIIVGLIFLLIGLADFIEEIIGFRGAGMILTGILVVIAGIWVGEKTRCEK